MIRQGQTTIHWEYFLALEEDLYDLARYVDFSTSNHDVYSIEIARLLMSACAEVDSVLKQLTNKLDPENPAKSIMDYRRVVSSFGPRFIDFRIAIPRYSLDLHPWQDWTAAGPPMWWTAHNRVKHQRHSHFASASLKNCLNAMAALLVSVVHLYSEEAKNRLLIGLPKLFTIPSEMGGFQSWAELGHSQGFYKDDADNPLFSRMAI